MRPIKTYIAALAAAVVLGFGTTACQDNFDEPNAQAPVATLEANTTIKQFKELMWKAEDNYCEEVYTKTWYDTPAADRTEEMKDAKNDAFEHIIIKGRVISSDYAGNVFKYIVIQDEEGYCLNFSINSYNLYTVYRRGQEVLIDLTGMYAGKYRGLFQIGFPSYNKAIPGFETSFLAPELFTPHAQSNGYPDAAKVDTVVVNSFAELGSTVAEQQKWQSRLVRFNNVSFVPNEEVPTLSTWHENTTQQIKDATGTTLDVRTSGYCNFWNTPLPTGSGDIVAICGYYVDLSGKGGYQLTLIDADSMIDFGSLRGSRENPYTVEQAIAAGASTRGWVRGYIVGTVAPEVSTVSKDADIQFSATPDLANTIVIGATPETTDFRQCLIVQLEQGTQIHQYAPLRENPGNYKKRIDILGTVATVMGTTGLTGNNGTSAEFAIEGVTIPDQPAPGADVVLLSSTDTDGLKGKGWTIEDIKFASGVSYVWSWKSYNDAYYLNGTTAQKLGDTESWAISPVLDMTSASGVTAKFEHAAKFQSTLQDLCGVYVRESGAAVGDWQQLPLTQWPTAGAWTWVWSNTLDLSAYAGKKVQIGFKYAASAAGADQWEVRNLTLSPASGSITVEAGSTPTPDPVDPTPDPVDPTPNPGDQGGTEVLFDWGNIGGLTPAYSEAQQEADGSTGNFLIKVNDVTFTSGSAAIVNSGTGTPARLYHQPANDKYSDTWTYRTYKSSKTTFAVADGYHITKIVFEPQTATHEANLANCTWTSGSYADKTWTPSTNVSSVTMTVTGTVGYRKITVYYAK